MLQENKYYWFFLGDDSLQKSFVWPPAPGRGEAACCHSTSGDQWPPSGWRPGTWRPGWRWWRPWPPPPQSPANIPPHGGNVGHWLPGPRAAASPVWPHRHPQQQQRPDCFLLQMTSTQLSPAADPASSLAPPSCHTWQRPLAELSGQRSRVHSIYTVSTQYLHSIYTGHVPIPGLVMAKCIKLRRTKMCTNVLMQSQCVR